MSAKTKSHAELFSAVDHSSRSSRIRALRSLIFKLNFGLLKTEDVSVDSQLLRSLLSRLAQNASCDVSSDAEELDMEVTLALQIIDQVSQETLGAVTLYGLNAISTLTSVKTAPWYRRLANAAIARILQNLGMAVKSSVVLPTLRSPAGLGSDAAAHLTRAAQPVAPAPTAATALPAATPLQRSSSSSASQFAADCARLLASTDLAASLKACRCLRAALPGVAAPDLLRSPVLFEVLLRRLSAHEGGGSRDQTPVALTEELLRTCVDIAERLQSWVVCHCSPLTGSTVPPTWGDGLSKDDFVSLGVATSLSIMRTALPWSLLSQPLCGPVASTVVAFVEFLQFLKSSLAPSLPHLTVTVTELNDTVELLSRCIRHCSKEIQQLAEDAPAGSCSSPLHLLNMVLVSTLSSVLTLFCPADYVLAKPVQDTVNELTLDAFLNIVHPSVVAGLLSYARRNVGKVWRDMRHYAHSVAAVHAFSGMTLKELQAEEKMSLRLARLGLPCLELLPASEHKRTVGHLCKFLIPRVNSSGDGRAVLLGLLAHSCAPVRQLAYEQLLEAWQKWLSTVNSSQDAVENDGSTIPAPFLLCKDVFEQVCLFGLYDCSTQVVDYARHLVCGLLQAAALCQDLHLSEEWSSCVHHCLPYLQAYAGNESVIDTRIMSVLATAAAHATQDSHASGAPIPECLRLRGLLRWMFCKHAKLRSWSLGHLIKALAVDNSELMDPFSRAPEAAIVDMFLVPSSIAPRYSAGQVPAERLKELLDILENQRLDVSLRVTAAQQILSAVLATEEEMTVEMRVDGIVNVMQTSMSKRQPSSGRSHDSLGLLEPCVGIVTRLLEFSPALRQQLHDDVRLYLTVFRACLLAPHNKTMHSDASRLYLHLLFHECCSGRSSPPVRFVSTSQSATSPRACFWHHIMERFDIRASLTMSPVMSSHACQPLKLTDTRPDLYCLADLQLLCNEWTDLTACCTAHSPQLCDGLLSQLVAVLQRSSKPDVKKLASLHLSSSLLAEFDAIRSARDHTSVVAALQQVDFVMVAGTSLHLAASDQAPAHRSSLFPRCAAPCSMASVTADSVLAAAGRFLSSSPASTDDYRLFYQLVTSLRRIAVFPGMACRVDLIADLARSLLVHDSVCLALLRQEAALLPDSSEFELWRSKSVIALLELCSSLSRQQLPPDIPCQQLLSPLCAMSGVLLDVVERWSREPRNPRTTGDMLQLSSTCVLSQVLSCLVHATSGLEVAMLHFAGNADLADCNSICIVLKSLVKVVCVISTDVRNGLSPVTTSLLRSASLCISHISGFLLTQPNAMNWLDLFEVSNVPPSPNLTPGLSWIKLILVSSPDALVRWSCVHWMSLLLRDQHMLAQVLAMVDDHSDSVWGLALDFLYSNDNCALLRKQACLMMIQLTHQDTVAALSAVCRQMSQSPRVQNLCTVSGLVAWLSSRSVGFFSWVHDAFLQAVHCQGVEGVDGGSGGEDGGEGRGDVWLSCLCPLLHNLVSLSCTPVVEQLLHHGVLDVTVSVCVDTRASLPLRLSCCHLLNAVVGVAADVHAWLISGDECPLKRLVAILRPETPIPVSLIISEISEQLFASSLPASRPVVSSILCQSWITLAGWCQLLLHSDSVEQKTAALSLLNLLLEQCHREAAGQQVSSSWSSSAPPRPQLPALLKHLELESEESKSCYKSALSSTFSAELSSGVGGGHLCAYCLCAFLLGSVVLGGGSRSSDMKTPVQSLLMSLLALSSRARKLAVEAGFIDRLVSSLRSCAEQLSAIALKVNLSNGERRALESSAVSACVPVLRLLQNIVHQDNGVKASLVTGRASACIHRLWCWGLHHESLMHATAGFLVSFTSGCSQACQSLLTSAPEHGTARSASSNTKSVVHFVVHRVAHLLSLTSRGTSAVSGGAGGTSGSLPGHDVSLLTLCAVLANCARFTACRRVLIREALLSRLHGSGHLPLKNNTLLHCALQVCLAMSFSQDGVAHLIKTPGMVDWLCDIGSSSRCIASPAPLGTTACSTRLGVANPRLCAATALFNIGIEHRRLLHTTDRPSSFFQSLMESGSPEERRVASEALSSRKVAFSDSTS